MYDLSMNEKSFTSMAGKLLSEEGRKSSDFQSLYNKIVSNFSNCHISEVKIRQYKSEISKCKNYNSLLFWLSNKFSFGCGNGVIKF